MAPGRARGHARATRPAWRRTKRDRTGASARNGAAARDVEDDPVALRSKCDFDRLSDARVTPQTFVVVSGLPASGKSTLAVSLGAALALPVLDKDAILESLFDGVRDVTAEDRRVLSGRADDLMRERALALPAALAVSWWRHPRSSDASGTPTAWLVASGARLVEVFLRCDPAVAAARFVQRRRHPAHHDARFTPAQLRDQFETQARFGALGLGTTVEVDANATFDAGAVTRDVARLMSSAR